MGADSQKRARGRGKPLESFCGLAFFLSARNVFTFRAFLCPRYEAARNAHIAANKTHVETLISLDLPDAKRVRTYATIPKANPSAILNESAIISMENIAGIVSVISSKSSSRIPCIIIIPTMMSAGAVASGGIIATSGEKNSASKNSVPTVIAVSPVLPPDFIPAADST